MATSDPDLVDEIRSFCGFKSQLVSDQELNTSVSRAKRHLKLKSRLADENVDWYNKPKQEEALFWASALFAKVQAGDLDSATVSVGAMEEGRLLANGGEPTLWYQNYNSALQVLAEEESGISNTVTSARTSIGGNRLYGDRR